MQDWETGPLHPTSVDEVEILVHLTGPDLAANPPRSVTLLWENVICETGEAIHEPMFEMVNRRVTEQSKTSRQRFVRYEDTLVFAAYLSPLPSEALIRMTVDVLLEDCNSIRLPHVSAMPPFMSFFVFDPDAVPTILPRVFLIGESFLSVLHQPPSKWLEPSAYQTPTSPAYISVVGAFMAKVSAAIIIPPGETPQVFDGALVRQAESGHKIHFLKSNSFDGYSTLNCIFEYPGKDGMAGA